LLVFGRCEGRRVAILPLRCTIIECNRTEDFLWACRRLLGDCSVIISQIRRLWMSGRQTGSYLPLNSTAKPQSLDVVPSSFPNYHVGLDLLIQLTKHHAELGAQKPQSSLWHEPLKSPQASIFSGWKEVEIAPSGRPKDCRCHVLGRAGTA